MKLYKDKSGNLVNLNDLTEIKIPKIGDKFISKLSNIKYEVKEVASYSFRIKMENGNHEIFIPFSSNYEDILKPYHDYPDYPPEDEWPSKPIPKEGYEWVKMPANGVSQVGDMPLMRCGDNDDLRWEFDEEPISYIKTVYFRLLEIKYEPLVVGDIFQEGDELLIFDSWVPYANGAYGTPFLGYAKSRRKIINKI